MTKNWHSYIHLDSSIVTVGEFVLQSNSLVKSLRDTPEKFIFFEDKDGTTNAQRIWNLYKEDDDLKTYPTPESITVDSPLILGTGLMIPKENTNNEMLSVRGKNLYIKQDDFNTFIDEKFAQIENDPNYVRENRVTSYSNQSDINLLQLSCQVLIYIRSIDKVIDVSNFISNLSTNKSDTGTFNISLSAIESIEDLIYANKRDTINYFFTEATNQYTNKKEFNDSWFHRKLQQNDIVFIRFEKLSIESDRNAPESIEVPPYALKNGIWDMIGLVDSNEQNYSPAGNIVNLSINGRDFTKLLIEDSAFFYPYALVEGSENFFINSQGDGRFLKRLFTNKGFDSLFAYTYRSIRDTLSFIFNQLTNVGVLESNELFAPYGDERSQTYEISDVDANVLKEVEQNGVWQIIKLLVDKQLDDRRLSDSSFSKPDGSIMEQINKTCQSPFVEFWGDTYGAFFNFISRQPPFMESQILDYLNNKFIVEVEGKDLGAYTVGWENEYYSVYQINPQNSFLGSSNFIALAHIPIVYFPEYINSFGNHKLSVTTNYISYRAVFGDNKKTNSDLFKKSIIEDFKYLIGSNFYLPFTRQGTFTIEGGDRRIKKGTWIRLKFSNEIAYVDAVSHSLTASSDNVSRSTSVQYSRAMKESHIRSSGGGQYSYFDIIDINYISRLLGAGLTGETREVEVTSKLLNKGAFNYFLQRRQMDKELPIFYRNETDNLA